MLSVDTACAELRGRGACRRDKGGPWASRVLPEHRRPDCGWASQRSGRTRHVCGHPATVTRAADAPAEQRGVQGPLLVTRVSIPHRRQAPTSHSGAALHTAAPREQRVGLELTLQVQVGLLVSGGAHPDAAPGAAAAHARRAGQQRDGGCDGRHGACYAATEALGSKRGSTRQRGVARNASEDARDGRDAHEMCVLLHACHD